MSKLPNILFSIIVSIVALPMAHASAACPGGEYYIHALGGYVLVPVRYMPYDVDLEPGITGTYRSPAPPMLAACGPSTIAGEGTIQTGTADALKASGRLPARAPSFVTKSGEFSITTWRFSIDGAERTTVLITKDGHGLRVFDADPDLWKRIVASYQPF